MISHFHTSGPLTSQGLIIPSYRKTDRKGYLLFVIHVLFTVSCSMPLLSAHNYNSLALVLAYAYGWRYPPTHFSKPLVSCDKDTFSGLFTVERRFVNINILTKLITWSFPLCALLF
ncbi:hypothetical protein BS47DRAFT_1345136 [Hydnum rufescens UP504]|uniref:Uncharacterized protein n=1 Tax=Hydnum rufescens UP504 TaxID=1448309 RepID=A0A9P6DVI1_9AGAM|nr:hypothetical protein BS47DRAFT_1345136 [Hydnum rufescens UP504]